MEYVHSKPCPRDCRLRLLYFGDGNVPFITFFPAVLFAGWYGGFRAGLVTLGLSALAADYYFVAPVGTLLIRTTTDQLALVIFLTVGLGMILLSHSQRRALERANQEAQLRKAAQDAERQHRERFETTLASIGDAVIATDAQGCIVFANSAAESILHWSKADIAGRRLDEVFRIMNEFTRATVESPVARVLKEGLVVGLANHTVLIAKDGTETPIDDSAAPIYDRSGAVQGTVLVFRDVSARRRAEATSRLLASIVESSDDAIISKDINGIVTSWNEGAERTFGYSAQEMIGQPISLIAAPDRIDEMPAILERIKKGERIEHYETVRRSKTGQLVNVSLTVSPVKDTLGRIIGASKIARDITQQVQAQKTLEERTEQLRASNEELSRVNQDLERFAFVASHDLQEPLRMITVYSQLLVKDYVSPADVEAGRYISYIVDGTTRMRSLLADLLTYAQIRGRVEDPIEAVDLNLIIEAVKQNLKAPIEESTAIITYDDMPAIRAHRAHLVPLFQNLIANAIKYRSERPPRIHISVQAEANHFHFAVTDNGIGIEPQYHQKIFEPFKRLHGRKISGTGIGLAICERVVERYGGRIWVESAVGQGSTFHFTLPNLGIPSVGLVK